MQLPPNIGKTREEAEQVYIPVNFNYIVTLPNGRQISAQTTYFPVEGTAPDAMLDKISIALERQRARHEIADFDAEIEEHLEAIAKYESEIARMGEQTAAQIEKLKDEHGEQAVKREEKLRELRDQHELNRGRSGSLFDEDAPRHKTALQSYPNRQAEILKEIAKLEEEQVTGIKNFNVNIAMFREKVEKAKAKRAQREKIVSPP